MTGYDHCTDELLQSMVISWDSIAMEISVYANHDLGTNELSVLMAST
jgi:hypothetical protein